MIRLMIARSVPALLTLLLALPAQAAFTVNGDGTITDTVTGLAWDRCSYGQNNDATCTGTANTYTWTPALGVAVTANAANYKGHNDWRLPNKNELESLVDLSRSSPAIDTTAFPNTVSGWYWSSTNYAPGPALAWGVDFLDGYTLNASKTYSNYVRLVRSGQLFDSFDAQGDVAPPVLSAAGVSGTTATATTLAATSNEAATGYWIVVPQGSTAPTAAQVKAGLGYGAVTLAASGNGAMTAATPRNFSVAGLTAVTPYDLYVVAEDNSSNHNLTPATIKVQFTTDQGGPGGGGGASSIPTLSEWGMVILSGLLLLVTLVTLRRQRL